MVQPKKGEKRNYWPFNTMAYVALRVIKADMPKLGTGKFCLGKPTRPKLRHSRKNIK